MLNNISEWNPQSDYTSFSNGDMYIMDHIAKWLIDHNYTPKTLSFKEYVLNIVAWIDYWNQFSSIDCKYILLNNESVARFFLIISVRVLKKMVDGESSLTN